MPKPKKVNINNGTQVRQVPDANKNQDINQNEAPGAGTLDNHEIVQPEGVDISQYRRLNILEVPTEELERRIAEANKVNANLNLVREKYEEAVNEVKKEVEENPNKYGTNIDKKEETLKKTLHEILVTVEACKIFTYTDKDGEKWVGSMEFFSSPNRGKYVRRALEIRDCVNKLYPMAKEKEISLQEFITNKQLYKVEISSVEDYDFETMTSVEKEVSVISSPNWFDAPVLLNEGVRGRLFLKVLEHISEVSDAEEAKEAQKRYFDNPIAPFDQSAIKKTEDNFDWDTLI